MDEHPEDEPPLIKVRLHDRGKDSETPWAFDLGPHGADGARRVRLDNVPFLHAKPTYGDEIIVEPSDDGILSWDLQGVPWERIDERIAHDGGRYAMIVDYTPHGEDSTAAYRALADAAKRIDAAPEGCFGPRDGRPGRMYVAVLEPMDVDTVMATLRAAGTADVVLVHPTDE